MNFTLRKVLTRRFLIRVAAVFLLYTVAGAIVVPRIIRWYAPRYIQQNFHCLATIDKVRINPFLLTLHIDGFSLKQADGAPLLAFEEFYVNIKASGLFRWAVALKEMDLVKPDIHAVIEADGSLNFDTLVQPAAGSEQPSAPAKPSEKPFRFILQNANIEGGQISVVDKRQSIPADFTLQGIHLHLKNISTLKDYKGEYHLAATAEDGMSIQWDGDVSLAPLNSQGKVSVQGVQTAALWKFFRDSTNLEQPAGKIGLSTSYRISTSAAPAQMTIDGLHITGDDLSFRLADSDKPFFQLKTTGLTVPHFDLASRELHVESLLFEDGAVDLRIDGQGGVNFEKILRAPAPDDQRHRPPSPTSPAPGTGSGPDQNGLAHESPPPPPPSAAGADVPFTVQADSIAFKNIALDLDDQSLKNPMKAAIGGADLHLQGKLETGPGEPKITVRDITSEIRGISLQSAVSKEPLFSTEKLTVDGGDCDLAAHSITFSHIGLSKGNLDVVRDAQGQLDWTQLFEPKGTGLQSPEGKPVKGVEPASAKRGSSKGKSSPSAEGGPAAKPATDTRPDQATGSGPDGAPGQDARPATDAQSAGSSWKYMVKSFEIEGFSSHFSDLATHTDKPVLGLQGITIRLTDVDGKSPMGFSVELQVEHGGSAKVSGSVNPLVPSVEADINLSGIVLTALQPYIAPYVTLKVQSGAISALGHLRYGIAGDPQKMAYQGSFSLDNLNLVDSASKKTYLRWSSVRLPAFKLTLAPDALDAQEIKVSNPVGELIIGEDRTLNFDKVLKKQPAKAKPVARTAPPQPSGPARKNPGHKNQDESFAYHISRILVEGGDLIFADLSLRPRFTTRIHDLKGTVTGLSSLPESEAKIQMDGHVDQFGMAKIIGDLRPNDFKNYSDLNLVFRNIEMKNMSPYSGKFAGRLIESGKFSADLKYIIKEGKMVGDNKIIIDNFVLGQQVDEPGATSLPLDLAIALLKDSNGRIDIGLPVTGDLNDPQFSIGPLIWTMFTNLITKAVTAPFHLLGNLIGGDTEKFDAVEFDPGSAELLPPEKEKLLKLADAMKNRPKLKLVIQGRYSPEIDGKELKDLSIRRTIAARLGVKTGPGDNPVPLDFTDSRTQNALEKLYGERFGKDALNELDQGLKEGTIKPRTESAESAPPEKDEGLKLYKFIPGGKSPEQKAVWARELNSRLVEGEKVDEQTYQQLAQSREQAVAANLEGEAQVPKERVSSKNSEALTGDAHPSASLSLDVL